MKQTIKQILKRTARFLLKPFLDDYLVTLSRLNQIMLSLQYAQAARSGQPFEDLSQAGFNLYTFNDEDGILLYIFSLIGMGQRKMVDIGGASIAGSTVANLVVNHGFSGLLIDCDEKNLRMVSNYYAERPETHFSPPETLVSMVTAENINSLLESTGITGEIDLLCLDIDGMDYWVLKAIQVVNPRVLVVEYQDILGPDRSCTVPYSPDFNLANYPVNREINNYCGASLTAYVKLCREKGYRLVGCNRGGWNAFFVRNDIGCDLLPEVSTHHCFQNSWNIYGMRERYPLVKDMAWQEV